MKYKILCIGNQWRGSDDGSLFRAFSRAGHLIHIVDDKFYYPADVKSFTSKVVRTMGAPFFRKDYNQDLIRQLDSFNPDIVCVYKGFSVQRETMEIIRKKGTPVFCIYPDVSFFDHGSNIPSCIPLYDFIFVTKSFGVSDLKTKFQFFKTKLIQHCADPDIHRIIPVGPNEFSNYTCDASFIGSYSPKKDFTLFGVTKQHSRLDLKIWGSNWDKSNFQPVLKCWQQQPVIGDLYAVAINCSKINLAILSEAGTNASSGDLVTSRTFHIPAAGGFMLHERTSEFLELFSEGIEAACFSGEEELTDKIQYYLAHDEERRRIATAGHERVMNNHTSDHRVTEILQTLVEEGLLKGARD